MSISDSDVESLVYAVEAYLRAKQEKPPRPGTVSRYALLRAVTAYRHAAGLDQTLSSPSTSGDDESVARIAHVLGRVTAERVSILAAATENTPLQFLQMIVDRALTEYETNLSHPSNRKGR